MTIGAVLPAFNEGERIGAIVRAVREHCPAVVVVDDGSADRTAAEAEAAGARVIRHPQNQGKGAALDTGFRYARQQGWEALVTLDADGQHDPREIPKFLEAYQRTRIPILVGNRMANPRAMPLVRLWTNRFMSWLLSRVMGQYVPDTQCGFRLFQCDVVPFLTAASGRFAAESEVLLQAAARGIRIDAVRIVTIYGGEKSKMRPIPDTIRFFRMLQRYRRERRRQLARRAWDVHP
jgi:glycosyltransferase involved in cell wall biosynthesis